MDRLVDAVCNFLYIGCSSVVWWSHMSKQLATSVG